MISSVWHKNLNLLDLVQNKVLENTVLENTASANMVSENMLSGKKLSKEEEKTFGKNALKNSLNKCF